MAAISNLCGERGASTVRAMQSLGVLFVALARVLLAALGIVFAAHAAEPATGLEAGLEQQVRELALAGTRHSAPGVARVAVEVGQLDPRLRLAPCLRIEPYLPPGTRLWGRARIGLRCTQGQTAWNVFLPITVKIYGKALVTTSPMPAGAVVAD